MAKFIDNNLELADNQKIYLDNKACYITAESGVLKLYIGTTAYNLLKSTTLNTNIQTTDNLPEGSTNLYLDNTLKTLINNSVQSSTIIDEDDMSSNSNSKIPTQQSVKAYIDTNISNLIDSAPDALNTLNELSAALGDDANFATTITALIGTKLDSSTYTASDILTKLLTVDGSGSGLDADKLDGHDSTYFLNASSTIDGGEL